MARRSLPLLFAALVEVIGCTRGLPTSPSLVGSDVPAITSIPLRLIAVPQAGSGAIAFPARNEPVAFREALNTKYQGRGASLTSSYVNAEGSVVWIQEYLRYRVNACSHAEAMSRVFRQVANPMDITPVCGAEASGTINFPPRDESRAFRDELEVRYRDVLRSSTTSSFVNIEGDIVWIQEYLRYRVNDCSHEQAQTKVFQQIDGGGIQPVCTAPPTINVLITGPTARINSNTTVTFSGIGSNSTGGRIVSYQWDCGQPGNSACTSTSATPSFRYSRTGTIGQTIPYTVTLTVTDERGYSKSGTYGINVLQAY
jgi:hypothetical protein